MVDLPTATEPAMPMMNGVLTHVGGVEEGLALAKQQLARLDMRRQQPRQRQIDAPDLVEVDRIVERAQPLDLLGRQRQRRVGAELGPRSAREETVGRVVVVGTSWSIDAA